MTTYKAAKAKIEAELANLKEPQEARQIIYELSKKYKEKDAIYDWDQYFMSIACLAALASEDPSSPVGACIVSPNKTVVGVGYNSMPKLPSDVKPIKDNGQGEGNSKESPLPTAEATNQTGKKDPAGSPKLDELWIGRGPKETDKFYETHYDTGRKFLYVVHAVVNAIINKTIPSLEGCTIYTTMPPDTDCAHAIIHSGITVVKYAEFYNENKKPDGTALEPLGTGKDRAEQQDIKKAEELLRQSDVLLKNYDMKEKVTEQGKKITKEPKVAINGKSISLSERISGEKQDKLELPELFKSIALLSAKKQGYQSSSASYTQGACIVDDTNKILSVGQSGYPEIVNDKAIQKDTDEASSVQNDFIAHAEYKAILARGAPSFKDCTLYVTKYPCNGCAQVIVQSGITKVYYNEKGTEGGPVPYDQLDSKEESWKREAKKNMYWASEKILLQNKIEPKPWEGEIKVEVQEV